MIPASRDPEAPPGVLIGNVILEEENVLKRLKSLEVRLPADNIEVQKDQHNITLENYCKLALELAETSGHLRAHLDSMLQDVEVLTMQQASDIFVLWAPVAEIMGWYDVKTKLEEIAFTRAYPEACAAIAHTYRHLGGDKELEAQCDSYVSGLSAILTEVLEGLPVTVSVSGRKKSDYSVWRKAVKRGADYLLPDFFGVRVVAEPTAEGDELDAVRACYMTCDVLSQCFEPDPGRFKNYIARPKPNGYQSIHMSLEDINGAPLECQIRTADMHEQAEKDPNASHLIYEATTKVRPGTFRPRERRKHNRLYDWREDAAHEIRARQAVGNTNLKGLRGGKKLLFASEGNIYELDPGATTLDFSFAVHSGTALGTERIMVDGASRPFDYRPAYGSVIAVAYRPEGQDAWTDSWQGVVTSERAKTYLRKARRWRDQAELINSGEARVDEYFKAVGLHNWAGYLTEADREEIAELYGPKDFETLLMQIATRPTLEVSPAGRKLQPVEGMGRIINRIEENIRLLSGVARGVSSAERRKKSPSVLELRDGHGIVVLNTLGCHYHFAKCCPDLRPPDQPVAVISRQKSDFSIHRSSCSNVAPARPQLSCSWYATA